VDEGVDLAQLLVNVVQVANETPIAGVLSLLLGMSVQAFQKTPELAQDSAPGFLVGFVCAVVQAFLAGSATRTAGSSLEGLLKGAGGLPGLRLVAAHSLLPRGVPAPAVLVVATHVSNYNKLNWIVKRLLGGFFFTQVLDVPCLTYYSWIRWSHKEKAT
jgi:hypothetical protein